jgi:hypothetical protein
MVDIERVRTQFQRIEPFLDERGRRLYAANEALGRGGVMAVAAATGIARSTINRGMCELRAARNEIGRVSVDPVPVANARSSANLACWPKAVREIAWKAQIRLCARYRRLTALRKSSSRHTYRLI